MIYFRVYVNTSILTVTLRAYHMQRVHRTINTYTLCVNGAPFFPIVYLNGGARGVHESYICLVYTYTYYVHALTHRRMHCIVVCTRVFALR